MLVAQGLLAQGDFRAVRQMLAELGDASSGSAGDADQWSGGPSGLTKAEHQEWKLQISVLRRALAVDRVALAVGAVVGGLILLLLWRG